MNIAHNLEYWEERIIKGKQYVAGGLSQLSRLWRRSMKATSGGRTADRSRSMLK